MDRSTLLCQGFEGYQYHLSGWVTYELTILHREAADDVAVFFLIAAKDERVLSGRGVGTIECQTETYPHGERSYLPGYWCRAHDVALGDDGSGDPELGRRKAGKGRQDKRVRLHDDEIDISFDV